MYIFRNVTRTRNFQSPKQNLRLEESKLLNTVTSSVAVNKTRFRFITGELFLLNNNTVAFTSTMYTFYNLMLHDVCDRRQCLSFQSCASCSVLSAEIRMFHAYLMIDITFVHVNGSPPNP